MTQICNDSAAQDGAVMNVGSWASRCTLDIIGVAGLGRDFGAIKDEHNKLVATYETIIKPTKQSRILGILSMFLPTAVVQLLPVKRNEDIFESVREIRELCADLIGEKRARLAKGEKPQLDILSVAMESGVFSDETLVDQMMTFLAAGHETTATALTWAVYFMCRHPDMQTRLRAEIRQKLPSIDASTDVNSLDIDHMPYLSAVCNEVLRYYPPVAVTAREASHDTTILGTHIPKGTRIVIAPWATNHDPSLWGPDAGEFNPERWMPKFEGDKSAASGGAKSNYAFMTFLHGPRSCIGLGFTRAEFACLLAAWVGRHEFELRDRSEMQGKKLEMRGGIISGSAAGLDCIVRVVPGW